MGLPGAKLSGRFAGWLRSRRRRRGLILLYHRVSEPADNASGDVFNLCIRPDDFAEHLTVLREFTDPLSLSEMVACLRNNNLPEKPVALTFDDGYADVLYNAKPLLERFEIPATVFVVSGYLGRVFWWDELGDAVFGARRLPRRLVVELDGKVFEREADEWGRRARRRLLRDLHQLARSLGVAGIDALICQVRTWCGASSRDPALRRCVSADELKRLASESLFTIGSHTVNHPRLARLLRAEQRREIAVSKRMLEETTQLRVESFAYPFGTGTDFNSTTIELMRELDVEFACTNIPGAVMKNTKSLVLPRFWAPAGSGAALRRLLERWLG